MIYNINEDLLFCLFEFLKAVPLNILVIKVTIRLIVHIVIDIVQNTYQKEVPTRYGK